jgi:hypothetical protein
MTSLGLAVRNRVSRLVPADDLDRFVAMIDDTAAAIEKS